MRKRVEKLTRVPEMVGVQEIARLLAGEGLEPLSERHVGRLVELGMPKAGHGEYDAGVCLHWYLGHIREKISRQSESDRQGGATGPRSLQEERIRLVSAQADAAEMVRDEKRGRLIPRTVYEQRTAWWQDAVGFAMSKVPGRIASQLVNQPRERMKPTIEKAMREALLEVAQAPAKQLA